MRSAQEGAAHLATNTQPPCRELRSLFVAGLTLVESLDQGSDCQPDFPPVWLPPLPPQLRRLRIHDVTRSQSAGRSDNAGKRARPADTPHELTLAAQLTRLTALTSLTLGSAWQLSEPWRRVLAPCAASLVELDVANMRCECVDEPEDEAATRLPALRFDGALGSSVDKLRVPVTTLDGLPALTRLRLTMPDWAQARALTDASPETLAALRDVGLQMTDHAFIRHDPAEARLYASLSKVTALRSLAIETFTTAWHTAWHPRAFDAWEHLTSLRFRHAAVDATLVQRLPRLRELWLCQRLMTLTPPPHGMQDMSDEAAGALAGATELRRVAVHGLFCSGEQAESLRQNGAGVWREAAWGTSDPCFNRNSVPVVWSAAL